MDPIKLEVTAPSQGARLDAYLAAQKIPNFPSRSLIQEVIRKGWVKIIRRGQGTAEINRHPSFKLQSGDVINVDEPGSDRINRPAGKEPAILEETEHFMVIDKPSGLLTHPTSSLAFDIETGMAAKLDIFKEPSVLSWLLHRFPWSRDIPRHGIVHRLDRGTSGLLLVAKTPYAYWGLVKQFKNRQIKKTYLALCGGELKMRGGQDSLMVDFPILKRYGRKRVRMVSVQPQDRPCQERAAHEKERDAQTEIRVIKNYGWASFLKVNPLTGRTHQIRLHLAGLGHPILGDPLYGRVQGRKSRVESLSKETTGPSSDSRLTTHDSRQFDRLMLHAWKLGFCWPKDAPEHLVQSPLPQDFILECLKHFNENPLSLVE